MTHGQKTNKIFDHGKTYLGEKWDLTESTTITTWHTLLNKLRIPEDPSKTSIVFQENYGTFIPFLSQNSPYYQKNLGSDIREAMRVTRGWSISLLESPRIFQITRGSWPTPRQPQILSFEHVLSQTTAMASPERRPPWTSCGRSCKAFVRI